MAVTTHTTQDERIYYPARYDYIPDPVEDMPANDWDLMLEILFIQIVLARNFIRARWQGYTI